MCTPFYFDSGNNFEVDGFIIDGENYKMSTESGVGYAERRNHLIALSAWCTNVTLKNLELKHSACDGLIIGTARLLTKLEFANYVETDIICKNIKLENINMHHNARMGLTIGVVTNLTVINCNFYQNGNTTNPLYSGLNPKAGMDIEPNDIVGKPVGTLMKNLVFTNCKFYDNVNQQATSPFSGLIESCIFNNCHFTQEEHKGYTFLFTTKNTQFNNCTFKDVKIPGTQYGHQNLTLQEYSYFNSCIFININV